MTILIAETNSISNHYNGVDEDHILIRTAPIKPVKKILRRRKKSTIAVQMFTGGTQRING